jgi:integrase/recombinase XerD
MTVVAFRVNTLLVWLVNAGCLAGNPLSLPRQRGCKTKPRVTRFLKDDLWQAVKASIDAMPRATAREQEHYVQVRWLILQLHLMALRISEVVSNPMRGFSDGAIAKGRTAGGWRSPTGLTWSACCQRRRN